MSRLLKKHLALLTAAVMFFFLAALNTAPTLAQSSYDAPLVQNLPVQLMLHPGEQYALYPVIVSNAARSSFVFTSDHPEIASVDYQGRILAHAPGCAVIGVSTMVDNLAYATSVSVTVSDHPSVLDVLLSCDQATLTVGDSCSLTNLVQIFTFPAVDNADRFLWRVGDSSVLSLTGQQLTALRSGETYLEAVSLDKNQASARMSIIVQAPPATPSPTPAPTPEPSPTPEPAPVFSDKEAVFVIPQEGPYAFTTFTAAKDGRYEVKGEGAKSLIMQVYHVRLQEMIEINTRKAGQPVTTLNLQEGDELYVQLTCDTPGKSSQKLQLTITCLAPVKTQAPAKATPTPKPKAAPTPKPTDAPTPKPTNTPAPTECVVEYTAPPSTELPNFAPPSITLEP